MQPSDIMFSVHDYDRDGDILEKGIYLHFGETRVKVSDDLKGFKLVVNRIAGMVSEISVNYANKGI